MISYCEASTDAGYWFNAFWPLVERKNVLLRARMGQRKPTYTRNKSGRSIEIRSVELRRR
jgi:hypothetical protein